MPGIREVYGPPGQPRESGAVPGLVSGRSCPLPLAVRVSGAVLARHPGPESSSRAGPRQGDRVRMISAAVVAVSERAPERPGGGSITSPGQDGRPGPSWPGLLRGRVLARTGRQESARTPAPRRGAAAARRHDGSGWRLDRRGEDVAT